MATKKQNEIDLILAVDKKIKGIRTRSLDISFNELLDMYKSGELIIDPDYQRLFRWDETKQSQFIESLILELPLPPIFVVEAEEGKFELIDGLQRISTYLNFRGELPNKKNLTLQNCDIVQELNTLNYGDLPPALRIKLKRNFIRVEIIRKESDRRLRYYMFKRLNTGGEKLSFQEIRNCTIHLLSDDFNNLLKDLSSNEDFVKCTKYLGKETVDKKGNEELILRFFAIKNNRKEYEHDVNPFLDKYMEDVSDPEEKIKFDYVNERETFEKTFLILQRTLGEYIFSDTNDRGTLRKRVSPYHYEAFSIGIQKYLKLINPDDDATIKKLASEFTVIKNDPNFRKIIMGGGKNTSKHLNARINFVEERVGAIIK
jgi:uncharacterized protein with ParB-like and HNH nuclease domain